MGNVSSRQEDGAQTYLREPNRFSIASVVVSNARGQTLLRVNPEAFPPTRFVAQRDVGDDSPPDYILDPETLTDSLPPSFLLRLINYDELTFTFVIHIRQAQVREDISGAKPAPDTQISGLTYVCASTSKELENITVREFHADPNIHKNANVTLIGDLNTQGSPSVQTTWTWRWRPPKPAEDRGGGWRNCCSFVEYDQRTDKLSTLASFSFWVQNGSKFLSAGPRSPRFEMSLPPRLRVPSSQSIESRFSNISDSEGEGGPVTYKDYREPQSPTFETIPENELGLGIVPSTASQPTATAATVKVDIAAAKSGDDPSTNEDGPLFRATMRSLEQKTGTMRTRMKKILRTAEAAANAQVANNNAIRDFTEALKEAATSNALDHYLDNMAREIMHYERQNTANLHKLIIEPFSKLYNNEIKQAELKKREFDEESKDYYAYTSKYLGQRSESLKEKKQKHTDEKYQAKRKTFELKRFDYSSFMHDLHGGRKDQEVLSQLTKYAEAQTRSYIAAAKKVEEGMPQLTALCQEVRSVEQDYQIMRTEREEKRRQLEKNTKVVKEDGSVVPTVGLAHSNSQNGGLRPGEQDRRISSANSAVSTSPPSATSLQQTNSSLLAPTASTATQSTTSPASKFKGIRDLDETNFTNNGTFKKEGLLWALSRPSGQFDPKTINKQGWHKFWIVLDQGKLSEYVNWKDRLDLHMEPIDLRMASVREARNSERRFCFEVITPQFTRVYQAFSDDDMKAWIGAVNNALQTAFEARQPVPASSPSPSAGSGSTRKDIAAVLTGKSTSFHGHRQASNPNRNAANSAVHRHATTGDRPGRRNEPDTATKNVLLERIRSVDAGNKLCVDCGSDSKVDWCSINLGVLLCIECSGIHRSLGTHISKVRSLTLDTNIFTQDIIEILLLVGNRIANMIWEAKLDRFLKPAPHSTREQRLHFITAKYTDRAYVSAANVALSADELLLTSIKKNDIQNVMQALALRANPNAHDRMRSTHALYLALAAADPASPASATPAGVQHARSGSTTATPPSSNTPSRSSTPVTERKPFAIAELLLQNGADIPTESAPIPLSTTAKAYLDHKIDLRTGRVTVTASPGVQTDKTSDAQTGLSRGGSAGVFGTSAPANIPLAGGRKLGESPRTLKRHSRQSIAIASSVPEVSEKR